MCPECEGIGRVAAMDEDALVDPDKSLNEGAIDFPDFAVDSWYWEIYAELRLLRHRTSRSATTPAEERQNLLYDLDEAQGQADVGDKIGEPHV